MSTIKKSYCSLCYSHCGVICESTDDKLLRISGDVDDPVSRGYLCENGNRLVEGVNFNLANKKITQPYKKINGRFEPISWDQALTEIADQLIQVIKQYGGNSILYMYDDITQQLSAEYSYRFFSLLGMKYFHTICSWEKIISVVVNKTLINLDSVSPDCDNSQVLMIIGKNAWVTQHTGPRIRSMINKINADPQRKLIVVDPVVTKTTKKADIHIQLRPGTDAWFLLSLMAYMAQNNLFNKDWTDKHETQTVLQFLINVDVLDTLKITGIPLNQLKDLASIIANSKSFSILTELGINHSINQIKSYTYTVLLQILTGNLNKPGGYLIHNHAYTSANYSTTTLDNNISPSSNEQIACGAIPSNYLLDNLDFKAVIVAYNIFDPLSNGPNKEAITKKFSTIPLKIAFGAMWNYTVQHVDYILPLTESIVHEYNISPTIWNDVLKLNEPVLKYSDSLKPIEDIIDILDKKMQVVDDYPTLLDKYLHLYQSNLVEFKNKLFREPGFIQMKLAKDIVGKQFKWDWLGVKWLYFIRKGCSFDEATELITELQETGFAKIKRNLSKDIKLNLELDSSYFQLDQNLLSKSGYEFILSCGFRREGTLNNVMTDGRYWVEIFPADAERLNIVDGDSVVITTNVGSLTAPCVVNNNLQPGYIRMPYFKEINIITDAGNVGERELNPVYKYQFANIKKL